MVFSGITRKKMCGGDFLKKNGNTGLFQENVEKNGVLAFFLVLIEDNECTFVISVTIT